MATQICRENKGVLFQLLIAYLCIGSQGVRAADWKERFLTEGVPALRKLEELTFRLQAKIVSEDVSSNGSRFSSVRECCFQDPWLLDIVDLNWEPSAKLRPNVPFAMAQGINSRYQFRIQRPKEGPFHITSLERVSKGPSDDVGPYYWAYAQSLSASWILGRRPFHEWLAKGGFNIDGAEPTTSPGDSGKTLVKLKTRYAPPPGGKRQSRDPQGNLTAELLLDPEDSWCIRSANYVYEADGPKGKYRLPMSVSIDYGARIDGMPVPSAVTEISEYPPDSGSRATRTEKSLISNVQKTGTVSEDRFMLSRFGLPEIDLETGGPRSNAAGYLLIGLSVISGLAAVFLASIVAKRKRKISAPG